ncbi:MAG: glycine cleavage system aminomethyltransferase GcvT [Chloroflexi bacterium]|nr:glycine cleavage system aminomethyltransferase GcvT [Chloroflexota bacterium]MCI0867763.1 glycine cleavage system aminomethyltransferase GcvT [Chloroflexota bacterium]MCI0879338.1 glycine cleavage system aminomethyltransferase GcvT [Chloroflexota bacterium]
MLICPCPSGHFPPGDKDLTPTLTTANLQTMLYSTHVSLGARMVPFGGWDMPVQYGGILSEVAAVRNATGLFDVSHMGRLFISGPRAAEFLDWVLTRPAESLRVGRARYCMICNQAGGVIDDVIFYRLSDDRFLLIPNAGNRERVVAWFQRWIEEKFSSGCTMEDRTAATGLIAFQGPGTPSVLDRLCDQPPSTLRPFAARESVMLGKSVFLGRTGYTGEDGFELVVDAADAEYLWRSLMDQGAVPCGLGARDVLRLEAGLPLHGHEIDEETTPIEAGLERFVGFDKDYVGAEVLRKQKEEGVDRKLVGLTLPGRSAPRAGYTISDGGEKAGIITSGSYSPTLDTSIAMGYVVGRYADPGQTLDVDIRGRTATAQVTPLPFYSRPRRPPEPA